MSVEYDDAFEHMLERQLQAYVDANRGPRPLSAQALYQPVHAAHRPHLSILAKAAAILTTKAAVGLFAGAAVVFAAAAGEVAVTGTGDPVRWAAQLEQQAQTCGAALAPASTGLGACMNTFVPQHSVHTIIRPQDAAPSTTSASDHSQGVGSGKAGGGPPPSKTGQEPPADKPTGGPPAGKPAGGPPAGGPPGRPLGSPHPGHSGVTHGNAGAQVGACPPAPPPGHGT